MKWDRTVFIAWEKLRALFLCLLAAASLWGLSPVWSRLDPKQWVQIVIAALIVNILFMLGPLVDCMTSLSGAKRVVLRFALFAGGTVISLFFIFVYTAGLHEVYLGK
jgi:hypothetical protein